MAIVFQYLSGFRHHFNRSSSPRPSLHSNNGVRLDSHSDRVNCVSSPALANDSPQNGVTFNAESVEGSSSLLLPPHEIHNSREQGSTVDFPFEGPGLLPRKNTQGFSGASSQSEEIPHFRQRLPSSIRSGFYAKKDERRSPSQEYPEQSSRTALGKRKRHRDTDSEAGSSLAAVEALLDDSQVEGESERRSKRARLRPIPKTVLKRTIRAKRPSNVPRHSDNNRPSATIPPDALNPHQHQHQHPPPQPLRPLRRQLQYQRINPTGRSNFENRTAPRPLRRDEDLVGVSPAGVPEVQKMHYSADWRAGRKNRPFLPYRPS